MSDRERRAIASYLAAPVVLMPVSMAACGAREHAGSNAARQAGRAARGIEDAGRAVPGLDHAGRGARADSRQLGEIGFSAAEEARMRDAAGSMAEQVIAEVQCISSRYTNGLTEDGTRTLIKLACTAVDIVRVGEENSWEDAAVKAVVSFGGRYTRNERIAEFASEVYDAKNATDAIQQSAGLIVCEWA